jgi:hypothetical protein
MDLQDNSSFIHIPYWSDNVTEVFALTLFGPKCDPRASSSSVTKAGASAGASRGRLAPVVGDGGGCGCSRRREWQGLAAAGGSGRCWGSPFFGGGGVQQQEGWAGIAAAGGVSRGLQQQEWLSVCQDGAASPAPRVGGAGALLQLVTCCCCSRVSRRVSLCCWSRIGPRVEMAHLWSAWVSNDLALWSSYLLQGTVQSLPAMCTPPATKPLCRSCVEKLQYEQAHPWPYG